MSIPGEKGDMERQSLTICLTDNVWLHRNLAALCPGMNVVRVDNDAARVQKKL